MKLLYSILVFLLLSGCGTVAQQSDETVTATPIPEVIQTSIPSSTPKPNLKATNQAATQTMRVIDLHAKYTGTAISKSTAVAKASSILAEIRNASKDIAGLDLSNAKLASGPISGSLTHVANNTVITYDPLLSLKNFVANVEFVNPYDTSTIGKWDYGILFRNKYRNTQYRLTFLSNQSWTLYNAEKQTYIYTSNDKHIKSKVGEENQIWLIVVDKKAYIFINGVYRKTLDVSANLRSGDISVGTGLYYGNIEKSKATEYKNFIVWSLP